MPDFSSNTTNYTVKYDIMPSSVTINSTAVVGTASIKVDSQSSTIGTNSSIVNLTPGTNNVVNIEVTAPDAVTKKTYTLTISEKYPMVNIAGGTFDMGYTGVAIPVHSVTLSAFAMGKYEVTYELWYEVKQWASTHGYAFTNAGREGNDGTIGFAPTDIAKQEPVTTINWYDAVKWCNAYSEKAGLTPCYYTDAGQTTIYKTGESDIQNSWVKWNANGYRLPTEAEWEYTAKNKGVRAGNEYSGSSTLSTVGWYNISTTKPVGGLQANELGIYDMSGNVHEWIWDWYSVYINDSPFTDNDSKGASTGTKRGARGWSYDGYDSTYFRNSSRHEYANAAPNSTIGFRLTRRPDLTNASLSGLTLSSGTLIPVFDGDTRSYKNVVSESLTNITVTPTALVTGATIAVNGSPVSSGASSGSITITPSVDNIITIVVIAKDGVTTKSYTVNVTSVIFADNFNRVDNYQYKSGTKDIGNNWVASNAGYSYMYSGIYNNTLWHYNDTGNSYQKAVIYRNYENYNLDLLDTEIEITFKYKNHAQDGNGIYSGMIYGSLADNDFSTDELTDGIYWSYPAGYLYGYSIKIGDSSGELASTPANLADNQTYYMKWRFDTTNIYLKWWLTSESEPFDWNLTAQRLSGLTISGDRLCFANRDLSSEGSAYTTYIDDLLIIKK